MEPLVDCVIEDERWEAFGLGPIATRAVTAALTALGLPTTGLSLVVMGCDDARIAALNSEFRGKTKPTNVLSWPAWDLAPDTDGEAPEAPEVGSAEEAEPLGDIALAYETCEREALAAGKPMADHVTHLVIHGLLHCLGYDHVRDGDAARMEGLEVQILASLGLPDPY